MEKRQHPRFPARFQSSFTSVNRLSGDGEVVDLSLRGCRLESSQSIRPGSTISLRIHVLPDDPPLNVAEAIVRWTRDGWNGIEFTSLAPEEWARLQHSVTQLELHPYQRADTEAEAA